jgi:UDP-glucose 4-epimerase
MERFHQAYRITQQLASPTHTKPDIERIVQLDKMMESKKVIVTGGCGFIGSHLVEKLLQNGMQVIVLDNLVSGKRSNLDVVKSNPNLSIIEADISTDFSSWSAHFRGVSKVFHLAALADIVPSLQKPLDYFRSNVTGTAYVLEASRMNHVEKFVYVASSSCYGLAETYPTPETAPIKPEYPYALTKYLGEELVLHWGKVFKLPVVSLRLFNVFGTRSRTTGAYGAVFGVFLKQKLARQPLTIVGDGTQTRDFTFVTDVVEALWLASTRHVQNEVFNVGSGKTVSVNTLADLLGGPRTHISKRPGEPDCTFADTTHIQKILGWAPRVTFEEGVRMMMENIKNWEDAPLWTPESIQEATKEWFHYLTPEKVNV